ncbi:MAG: hypothetical protein HN929_12940, partial [Chloroflexi bacterium]|nr:hypothetical protein [Chloroflexota bacterium]
GDGVSGGFDLTNNEMAYLHGATTNLIGQSDGTGAIAVGTFTHDYTITILSLSGAISITGDVTMTGDAPLTIETRGADTATDVTLQSTGSITMGTGTLNMTSGTGDGDVIIATGGTGISSSGDIVITSDTSTILAPVATTGTFTVQPTSGAADPTIGIVNDIGLFTVNTNELPFFRGVTNNIIGRADGTGAIEIGALSFGYPLTVRTLEGSITVAGAIFSTADLTLTTGVHFDINAKIDLSSGSGDLTLTAGAAAGIADIDADITLGVGGNFTSTGGGNFDIDGDLTVVDGDVIIEHGGYVAISTGYPADIGSGDVSIKAGTIIIDDDLTTTGTITIEPYTDITIGISGGAGTLNFTAAEMGKLKPTGGLTIGRSDGTAAINVGAGTYNTYPLTILGSTAPVTFGGIFASNDLTITTGTGSGTGIVDFNAAVTATGNVSITADEVTTDADLIASGTITLTPSVVGLDFAFGASTGADFFTTQGDSNNLLPDGGLIIGRADGTGTVYIGTDTPYSFNYPATILTNGAVTLAGMSLAGAPEGSAFTITGGSSCVITTLFVDDAELNDGGIVTNNGPINLTAGTINCAPTTGLGTLDAGTGAITITADAIALDPTADSIITTGAVILQPLAVDTAINIATTSTSDFYLSATEIAAIKDGTGGITIGRTDGEHVITTGIATTSGVSFNDNVTIQTPSGGSITVYGPSEGTGISGAGTVTLDGSGATTNLNANIVTAGAAINIDDNVLLGAATITLDTTDGDAAGANIDIAGTTNSTGGARNLILNAGTGGAITLTGAVGGGAVLDTITITQAASALFSAAVTTSTSVVLTDTVGTITFAGALTTPLLTTAVQDYNLALNGGGTITADCDFLNTGTLAISAGATFTGGLNTTTGPSTVTLGGTISTTNTRMDIGAVTLSGATILNTGNHADAVMVVGAVTSGTNALTLNAGSTAGATITLASMADTTDGLTITHAGGLVNVTGVIGNSAAGILTITNSIAGVTFDAAVTATTLTITDTTDGQAITFDGALTATTALVTAAEGYNIAINGGGTITGDCDFLNTGTLTIGASMTFDGGFDTTDCSSTSLVGTIATSGDDIHLGVTTLAGATVINSVNGDITFAGTVNNTQTLTVDAGTGLLTTSAIMGGDTTLGAISFTSDTIAIGANITGNSTILLQPSTVGQSIGIGDAAAGTYNLDVAEIGRLQDGFTGITIGRADGTHAIKINQITFDDSTTIQTTGVGTVDVDGAITMTGTASLAITSSGGSEPADIDVNALITTASGDVTLTVGSGDADVRVLSGGITSTSGDITITSATCNVQADLTTAGTLTIKPSTASQTIGFCDSSGQVFVVNSDSDLLYMKSSTSNIIGRTDGTGAIIIGAFTYAYPLTIQTGAAAITVSGQIDMTSTASLELVADGNAEASDITVGAAINMGTGALTMTLGEYAYASGVSGLGDVLVNEAITSSGDITITSNTATLKADMTTSGTIIMQPTHATTSIGVSANVSDPVIVFKLYLDTTEEPDISEFGHMKGTTNNIIGRTDGTAAITIGEPGDSIIDPVLFTYPLTIRSLSGNITVEAPVEISGASSTLDIDTSGTFTVNASSAISTESDITIAADAIALGSAISTTGMLTAAPSTASTAIGIGTGAAGAFALTDAEVDFLQSSTSNVIGHASGTGLVTVNDGLATFANHLTIQSGGDAGSITVAEAISMAVNKNLAFIAGTGDSGTFTVSNASGTITTSGTGTISITADSIALDTVADTITGAAAVALQPATVTRPIVIGAVGEPTDFALTQAEINSIKNTASGITIGRADGQHVITISAITFDNDITIQTPVAGSILVEGAIQCTGDASITFIGSGSTLTIDSDIITNGQPIIIRDSIILDKPNVLIDTTGGGSAEGASVDISGNINSIASETNSVTFDTGTTGSITVEGAIGGNNPISEITITQSNNITFVGNINAETVTISNMDEGATIEFQGDVTIDNLTAEEGDYNVSFTGETSTITNAVVFLNTGTLTLGEEEGEEVTFGSGYNSDACSEVEAEGEVVPQDGDKTYGDLTLTEDLIINPGAGHIIFNGNIDGDYAVTVTAGEYNITFIEAIGENTPIASLSVLTANTVIFRENMVVDGDITITAGAINADSDAIITANGMNFTTDTGIGSSSAMKTMVSELTATNSTSGDIWIRNNTTALTPASLTIPAGGVTNSGGAIRIEQGYITFNSGTLSSCDTTTGGNLLIIGAVNASESVKLHVMGNIYDRSTSGTYDVIGTGNNEVLAFNGSIGEYNGNPGTSGYKPVEVDITGNLYVHASQESEPIGVAIDGTIKDSEVLSAYDGYVSEGLVLFNGRLNGGERMLDFYRARLAKWLKNSSPIIALKSNDPTLFGSDVIRSILEEKWFTQNQVFWSEEKEISEGWLAAISDFWEKDRGDTNAEEDITLPQKVTIEKVEEFNARGLLATLLDSWMKKYEELNVKERFAAFFESWTKDDKEVNAKGKLVELFESWTKKDREISPGGWLAALSDSWKKDHGDINAEENTIPFQWDVVIEKLGELKAKERFAAFFDSWTKDNEEINAK